MSSKTLIKIIKFLVFVVVIATPLFYIKQGVFPFILSKTLFFQAIVEILFGFWLVLAISDRRYRIKFTPLTTSLFVFLATLLATSFIGIDPWRSFWSTYERTFGIFTILHLAAFFLVLSSLRKELPWRAILYASIGTALVTDIIAILQLNIKNLLLEEPGGVRPGATFGNPTFLAGYLLFNVFVAFYLVVDRYRRRLNDSVNAIIKKNTLIYGFLPYLFLISSLLMSLLVLFLAETRGDILGLAVAVFVLLVMFAIRPPDVGRGILAKRWLYTILLVLIVLSGTTFWFTRESSLWVGIPGLSRFKDISLQSEGLQPRIIALRAAWQGFLDRPLSGVGWDNFNIVFNKYYDPSALRASYQETRFDKPHNFLMEDLVVGGLPLTLAHLAFLGFIIYEASRTKDKLLGQIVAASMAGYFVRNLFVFDTLGPVLMLYLIAGLVDGNYRLEKSVADPGESEAAKKEGGDRRLSSRASGLIILAVIIFAYFVNVRAMQASYRHFNGFINVAGGRVEKGIDDFSAALNIWSPYRWNFARDFAAVTSETYFYNPSIISDEDVLLGLRAMEKVAREHPEDAYNHYALVDMYNQISDISPEKFFAAAEREAALAFELSPDRQEIYFSLAKTKTLKGDYSASIELLDKALELDDQVADAHFYYGVVSFANGDLEAGYREVNRAIELGREWKTFYEPRTIANFFADSGRFGEAVELYEVALKMRPAETETKIKLGVAYFFVGNDEGARELLEEAGKEFDYRGSVAYVDLKPILEALGVIY